MTEEINNQPPQSPPAPPPTGESLELAEDSASKSLNDALRTSFVVLKIAMILAIIIFFLRGIFTVETGTVALVSRFGAYVKDAEGVRIYKPGGIYYALPVIDRVDRVELRTYTVQMQQSFTRKVSSIHRAQNQSPTGALRPGIDGYLITGDTNILHATWTLEYRVTDPHKYLVSFQPRRTGLVNPQTGNPIMRPGPEHLLREAFRNAAVRVTAGIPIDMALRHQNYEMRVQTLARRILDHYKSGINLTSVKLTLADPPSDTAPAFNAVRNAQSQKQKLVDESRSQASRITNEAASEAESVKNDALVYREDIIADARSDAENMTALLAKFPDDPESLNIYLQQLHQERISQVLGRVRLFLLRPGETWYMTAGPMDDERPQNGNSSH